MSPNAYLGDAVINLRTVVEDVADTNKPIYFSRKYYKKLIKPNNPDFKVEFYDDDSFWIKV